MMSEKAVYLVTLMRAQIILSIFFTPQVNNMHQYVLMKKAKSEVTDIWVKRKV